MFVYLDDIIIFSKNTADHIKHIQNIFNRIRDAGLRLNPNKCSFGLEDVKLLGYIVNGQGIKIDPEKVKAISHMTAPKDARDVRRFFDMTGFYRTSLPNYAKIAEHSLI